MYVSAADSRTAVLVLIPAALGVAIGLSCWQAILLRRSNAHPARYLPLVLRIASIGMIAWFTLEGALDWRVWSSLVAGAVIILAIGERASRKARSSVSQAAPPALTQNYLSGFATMPIYLLIVWPLFRERTRELAHGIVITHAVVAASVADSLDRLSPPADHKGARSVRITRASVRTSFARDDWNGPHTVCDELPLHINVDLLKWPNSSSDSAFEARAIKAARAFLSSHRRSSLAKPTMTIDQCAAELRKALATALAGPQRVATSAWLSAPEAALSTPAASPRSPQ